MFRFRRGIFCGMENYEAGSTQVVPREDVSLLLQHLARVYGGIDFTVRSGKSLSLNAARIASSSQAALSISLKRTSRFGTSVLIEFCSTHGRVASAARARGGHATG